MFVFNAIIVIGSGMTVLAIAAFIMARVNKAICFIKGFLRNAYWAFMRSVLKKDVRDKQVVTFLWREK